MMKRRDFFRILKSRGFGVALSGRGTFLLKEKCPKETSACGLIPCENRRGGFFHPPSGGAKLTTVSSRRNASADSTVVQTMAPLVFASDGVLKTPNALKAETN